MTLKIRHALLTIALFLATSPAQAIYTENWQAVDNETFHDATDWNDASYIRSETTIGDNGYLQQIIESYNYGNDGYMYVVVVIDGALTGYYRYPYTCATCNENNPDPFGDMTDPGNFTPPGGDDWANNGNYNGIPAYPEPAEWVLWLVGIGVVAWTHRKRGGPLPWPEAAQPGIR